MQTEVQRRQLYIPELVEPVGTETPNIERKGKNYKNGAWIHDSKTTFKAKIPCKRMQKDKLALWCGNNYSSLVYKNNFWRGTRGNWRY